MVESHIFGYLRDLHLTHEGQIRRFSVSTTGVGPQKFEKHTQSSESIASHSLYIMRWLV